MNPLRPFKQNGKHNRHIDEEQNQRTTRIALGAGTLLAGVGATLLHGDVLTHWAQTGWNMLGPTGQVYTLIGLAGVTTAAAIKQVPETIATLRSWQNQRNYEGSMAVDLVAGDLVKAFVNEQPRKTTPWRQEQNRRQRICIAGAPRKLGTKERTTIRQNTPYRRVEVYPVQQAANTFHGALSQREIETDTRYQALEDTLETEVGDREIEVLRMAIGINSDNTGFTSLSHATSILEEEHEHPALADANLKMLTVFSKPNPTEEANAKKKANKDGLHEEITADE